MVQLVGLPKHVEVHLDEHSNIFLKKNLILLKEI